MSIKTYTKLNCSTTAIKHDLHFSVSFSPLLSSPVQEEISAGTLMTLAEVEAVACFPAFQICKVIPGVPKDQKMDRNTAAALHLL